MTAGRPRRTQSRPSVSSTNHVYLLVTPRAAICATSAMSCAMYPLTHLGRAVATKIDDHLTLWLARYSPVQVGVPMTILSVLLRLLALISGLLGIIVYIAAVAVFMTLVTSHTDIWQISRQLTVMLGREITAFHVDMDLIIAMVVIGLIMSIGFGLWWLSRRLGQWSRNVRAKAIYSGLPHD
jgi:hypothetical protein